MNDFSFTILIPALVLLSVAMVGMLYARFASRSRENSEEIDLVEIDLARSRISAAAAEERQLAGDETQRVPFLEPRPEIVPVLEVASSEEKVVEESYDDETEYFDELQEAAAGLAALMRSSPVGKRTPVVYAPEDLEDETLDVVHVVASEDEPQEILLPVSESVSGVSDAVDQLVDAEIENKADVLGEDSAALIFSEESESESSEVEVIASDSVEIVENAVIENVAIESSTATGEVTEIVSGEPESEGGALRALLGDEVADQFDSLDDGLSDLENLVVSIESALSSLNDVSGEMAAEDEPEAVSEAA